MVYSTEYSPLSLGVQPAEPSRLSRLKWRVTQKQKNAAKLGIELKSSTILGYCTTEYCSVRGSVLEPWYQINPLGRLNRLSTRRIVGHK